MESVKCKVRSGSAQYGVESVKCGVFKVESVKCKVWGAKCSVECGV